MLVEMLIPFALSDVILDKVSDFITVNDVIIFVNKHLLSVVFIYF